MVQKSVSSDTRGGEAAADDATPRKRGRPRAYQPEVAIGKALDVFRKDGYAATSLDDLSAATGMNRPSLYGAFGDKRELYIKSYQRYRADARKAIVAVFRTPMPLRTRLQRVYELALQIYLSGEGGPTGCFTVMTAASDAIADADIRAIVQDAVRELDTAFAASFQTAIDTGELPRIADPHALAALASATLHTLSVRARARMPRADLEALIAGAIDVLCGPARTSSK